jgi:CBS domain-containing protein
MKRKVNDLLKEKGSVVYTVYEHDKLKDAVKLFNQKRIGALIVLNDEDDIQGIITERDILKKLAKTEGEVKDMGIHLLMTPKDKLIVGTPEDTLEYLMKIMTVNHIRHIPIVGGETDSKLRGVVSIGDVVKAMLSDLNYENKFLKDYLERSNPI